MAKYCSLDDVKTVLGDPDKDDWDEELEDSIISASALVDSLLTPYDLTVSSTVPQNIKDATAYFAAWKYRRPRDPAGAQAFWDEANKFLQVYVEAEKEDPGFRAVQP